MNYTELQVTTNFSFLRGASHPDKLLERALELGHTKLGITDHNSVSGIPRSHATAKANDLRLIIGCRLDLQDGPSLLAYPTSFDSYQRLSGLLTLGNRRSEKGDCKIFRADVYERARGLMLAVVPPRSIDRQFEQDFAEYHEALGRSLNIAASYLYSGKDPKRLAWLAELSAKHFVPMLATNDVLYHVPQFKPLQDVLTCIREKTTIDKAGFLLEQNAERCLKSAEEMQRLFRDYPAAIRQTQVIAEACRFNLSEIVYEYPHEITSEGRSPQEELEFLVWQGVKEMIGLQVPDKIRKTIEHELAFIKQVDFAQYFLTVYDIVRFARSEGIQCQGRGSAANSAVCYYLKITSVDPAKHELLFERFISSARNEPPDIDIDFEHERREEVIQYIYEKYGRDRAALTATYACYRQKGAMQDVGKAMGLSKDITQLASETVWSFSREWFDEKRLKEQGLDIADPRLRQTIILAAQILDFPRHHSQHPGGFVITRGSLGNICPIMNASMVDRTNLQWDKHDIEIAGLMKIDVLGLGILTAISKCFQLAKQHYGKDYTLHNIPQDCPLTYDMISWADTAGVFQIESRAQMNMLPRLKPRNMYDLTIQVAIVRPGPIQGDMVHPYIARRNGLQPVEFPSLELRDILGKTLGVPLFQEQAMRIAIVAAGFAPADADRLRRSMATFKFTGGINMFHEKVVDGMVKNGYEREFAERVFKQLEGFGSYGFPESHAASFAQLVYVSCWLKCHHPDVFACALLNSQPMGFYQPAQLLRNAQEKKVKVRHPDINRSHWDYTLEEQDGWYKALRIGFRQITGLPMVHAMQIAECRDRPYTTVSDIWHRTGVSVSSLEILAKADCFQSLGLNVRQALWEVTALANKPSHLLGRSANEAIFEDNAELPEMTGGEQVVYDYSALHLSLKAHPLLFLREKLAAEGVKTIQAFKASNNGTRIKVAGLVTIRQRPGSAKGICFVTIEDETSDGNVVVFVKVFDACRAAMMTARLIMVEGWAQVDPAGIRHLIAKKVHDYGELLGTLSESHMPVLQSNVARADEIKHGSRGSQASKLVPAGRNFH